MIKIHITNIIMAITLKQQQQQQQQQKGVSHSWKNEKLILNSGRETSSEEMTWVTYVYKK